MLIFVQVQHLLRTGCDIFEHLRKCEFLELTEPGLHDDQMTPDSVLEHDGWTRTESCSTSGLTVDLIDCTTTTEVVRKKRTGLSRVRADNRPDNEPVFYTSEVEGTGSRRKGMPRRAPFH